MSVETPLPNAAAPEPALQSPGALLQQERLRRGLSVQQSAEGLHLDPWIVEAIEGNQFLALGAPVYAKGYLRKYALLLGLAPEVVVSRYDALSDTPIIPTPVPVITTTPPPRPKWPKYVGWSVVAAIAIGIGVGVYQLLMPPVAVAVAPSTTASVEPPATTSVATTTAAATPPPVQVSEPAVAVVPATQQVVPKPTPTPTPTRARVEPPTAVPAAIDTTGQVASGSDVRLRLVFNESSWVEVYDAAGKRLLYDIGQAGQARTVSGVAPLNVVVGMASAVTAEVNDQPIIVPRRANRDSSRFSVSASGAVN